ncbi:hypothetical protein [Corynebacterium pacaense]|uniref:hypothetical protein n=1 Tax=Corynebacterium pacaense TaxID=1816684 RepID=UPI0009BC5C41|nr:hypothetical protein [Corynebacterium pacaense]
MKLRIIPALVAVAFLAGCSGDGDQNSGAGSESIEVSTSSTPSFVAQVVSPINAPDDGDPVVDPGLNVEYRFQGTGYGTNGGSVIYLAVKNLNEVPLPADAIGQPTLKIKDYNGSMTDIESLPGDDNIPLDLPLGVGATTNLQWAFNTSTGSLWSAEFRVGNVIFRGNLNNM